MTNASDSTAKAIARMLETQRAINGLARQLELLSSTTRMLSPLSLEADRVYYEPSGSGEETNRARTPEKPKSG